MDEPPAKSRGLFFGAKIVASQSSEIALGGNMAKEIIPEYRLVDPGKAGILGCTGEFEPENRQPHGPMRPGKTAQDRVPKEQRPRYQAWLKTQR